SVRAKFKWAISHEKKLGVPPPPELANFGLSSEDKKRKRTKILKKVFVKEDVVVDETHRNLIPPSGVEGRTGLVIHEPEAEPMKELIPYLEEGGSNPTMLNPKSFVLQEGHLTIEDILAQAKEMKRLPNLKVEKEKSEESLKKCSTQLLLKLIHKSRLNMRRKRPKCLRNTTSVSMRGLINFLSPRFTTESTRLRMLQ
nr:hypothetical protein [Tanacetum cinerariifolium]